MADIALRRVVKRFGDLEVVHGVDLDIVDREFIVLVGPSGCGKSTIMRMIAGLETVTDGEILIGGDAVTDLEPGERNIAMVFQDYALYPHMTAAENMSFGLRMRRFAADQIKGRIENAGRSLQIAHLLGRRPGELSGGQRQRVATGRAIVRRPNAFLFDEPLSNLDAKLRADMRIEIKRLHQSLRATTVYVTHDQVEAMTMADRIVVLRDGRIEQIGTPEDVYDRPRSMFVAGFIGSPTMNFLKGHLHTTDAGVAVTAGPLQLSFPDRLPGQSWPPSGSAVVIGIRPEHIGLASHTADDGFEASIDVLEPLGSDTLVHASADGQGLVARVPPRSVRSAETTVRLRVNAEEVHLFDAGTEQRLL